MNPLCAVTLFGSPDRRAVSSPLTGEDWAAIQWQQHERDRSDDVDDLVAFPETILGGLPSVQSNPASAIRRPAHHLRRDVRGSVSAAAAETQLTRADVSEVPRIHVGAAISLP